MKPDRPQTHKALGPVRPAERSRGSSVYRALGGASGEHLPAVPPLECLPSTEAAGGCWPDSWLSCANRSTRFLGALEGTVNPQGEGVGAALMLSPTPQELRQAPCA